MDWHSFELQKAQMDLAQAKKALPKAEANLADALNYANSCGGSKALRKALINATALALRNCDYITKADKDKVLKSTLFEFANSELQAAITSLCQAFESKTRQEYKIRTLTKRIWILQNAPDELLELVEDL